jgi:hypothetical protein
MATGLGLNRRNDTPIGAAPEFRANMQDTTWGVDNVPAWDGEKFAPASNSALLLGYGGLVTTASLGHIADGSVIDDWEEITPLLGTPLQTTPDPVTGLVTIVQAGVYRVDFSGTFTGMFNNESYNIVLQVNGGNLAFGAVIDASNNVSSQTASFNLMAQATGGGTVGVAVENAGSSGYDVTTASLTVTRIG